MARSPNRGLTGVVFLLTSPCFAQSAATSPSQASSAQEQELEPTASRRPEYEQDRSDESWRFLQDPSKRTDTWDRLKYIPLGRKNWYFTAAGEIRPFYEYYHNYDWGGGAQDSNGYFLNRLLVSTDFHFGDRARVFFELRSGLEGGRNGGPRPSIDKDTLDVSQAFAGFALIRGNDEPKLELKIGRQELDYGVGSLLAIRELNVGRTFDGVKLIVRPRGWRIDLLAFRPQLIKTGTFDDGIDSSQALWGVWATRPVKKSSFWRQVDLYYLGLDRKQARFQQGTAREQRQTIGVLVQGQHGLFSMFTEADLQFGRFAAGNIRAWKYAQSLSWSFRSRPLRPVVSLLGAISSGDKNPDSADLQTFNPLYPRGLYYGYIESTGSPNAMVLHPEISLTLSPSVSVVVTHFSFWRTSLADGIYSQPGFFLRPGNDTQSRYVGSLQDLAITWRADRHTTFQLLATYYEAGAYLRQTGGKNLFYVSLKMSYRF